MNKRSFRIIVILLSCSVLMILLLQAFWLRSFYRQKTDILTSSIYSALEQVGNRLKNRETIEAAKDKIFVSADSVLAKPTTHREMNTMVIRTASKNQKHQTQSRQIVLEDVTDSVIVSDGNGHSSIIVSSPGANGSKAHSTVSIRKELNGRSDLLVNNLDSARTVLQHKREQRDKLLKDVAQGKEIKKLMDQMLLEIRVIDDNEYNKDSIEGMIQKTLHNKGLFLPFEFAIQNRAQKKPDWLVRSNSFDTLGNSFVSDLSVNSVLRNNKFLLLQYPGLHDEVMIAMRSSLILSLLFSVFIIGVFAFSLKLILKQKKISDLKNDFINNMTHELKTPIATISLAVAAINRVEVRADVKRFLEYSRILREENEKLNSHVERVLQMSLLEKDLVQLEKKQIDLRELLDNCIRNFSLRAEKQNAKIVFVSESHPAMFNADQVHLESVFANLIDNALKYGGENCTVEVTLKKLAQTFVVEVKDNGKGIASDQQEKIFEKFYRVQGGDLHDVKGFGLGLSYVKSIVELHGGTVGVKSNADKGSIFTIVFKADE